MYLIPFDGTDSMTRYSQDEKQRLLAFPLEGVLSAYGRRTDHKGYMYYSPFREEDSPSFHIDARTNMWYDFGSAEGGGLVDLVCRLGGCDKAEVLDVIAGLDRTFVHVESPAQIPSENIPRAASSAIRIERVSDEIRRYALLEYALGERGIPMDILKSYCKEISYRIGNRHDTLYYAIGFPNNSGGWVLRSARTKICSSSDVTTLDSAGRMSPGASSRRAYVFEGFFDMLSWRAIYGRESLNCDVCVLNSVSNWRRAEEWLASHGKICLCLDNDEAGRRAVQDIAQSVKKRNGNLEVWDMSPSYVQYKDVGEMLQAQGPSCAQSARIR